jgi:hypothetical protein
MHTYIYVYMYMYIYTYIYKGYLFYNMINIYKDKYVDNIFTPKGKVLDLDHFVLLAEEVST